MQTRQLIEGITTPRLDSSMILLHGFGHRMGCPVRCRLEPGKEIAHRIGQVRLVVPERQDVIGATIADGLGTHGIERNDAAFQRQGSQEFRNGWTSPPLPAARAPNRHLRRTRSPDAAASHSACLCADYFYRRWPPRHRPPAREGSIRPSAERQSRILLDQL